jgi:8-oxo-dGTP pyrophosphatase MutT (NUDIX family)
VSGSDGTHGQRAPAVGARGRYVHRVTPDDVGQRVSIRHLGAATEADPRPSDVVGRLIGHDGELLLIVDRHEQLYVVPDAEVLASKVVPPHPRRPPEPMVGTSDAPLVRQAARVLLLDTDDRALLIAHVPREGRWVWSAPGGGLQPDEDHRAAAQRELTEELGLDISPGPWIWSRRVTFPFRGIWLDQAERWFLARTERWDPVDAPLDDHNIDEARWFSVADLQRGDVEVAPRALAEHLAILLRDGPPEPPIDVGY